MTTHPHRPTKRYSVHIISLGNEGKWIPGEIIARTDDAYEAKRMAEERAPHETLGTVIRDRVERTLDWGDEIEFYGEL